MSVIVLDDLYLNFQRLASNNMALNIHLKFETRLLVSLLEQKALSVRTKLKSKRTNSAPKTSGHFYLPELKLFCELHLLSLH